VSGQTVKDVLRLDIRSLDANLGDVIGASIIRVLVDAKRYIFAKSRLPHLIRVLCKSVGAACSRSRRSFAREPRGRGSRLKNNESPIGELP
jgi:hypothetical protein